MIEYILARPFIALLGLLATLHTTLLFLFNSGMGLNTISIYAAITILFLFLLLRKTRFSELLIFVLIILSLRLIQHFALSHRQENYKIEVCKKATDYMVVEAATARNHKLYVKGYFFRNECLERVYLTILKAPESQILYYGDTIWTASELNPVHNKPSRLFQAFDCYLTTIHVNYKSFIPYSKIKLSSFNGFSLLRVSQYLSEKCQQTIRQHIPTGQLAHLMIALLLGNKSGLDSQIKSDFIQSGTAHILAVSGLHLGMLYSILLIITNIINKARILTIKPLSKYFIIILSIWAFVLLTGSGNSIIRAAIMISYLETGKILKRNSDTLNSLFSCGFIMCFVNPCTLFEIGFQLSFCAVLSIVLYNPFFSRIIRPTTVLAKYLIDIVWVSISAQILITPICIYYFYQFPVYFIIGNLIWIPISFLLLFLGICILCFSLVWPTIAIYTGLLCEKICTLGLSGFQLIEKLPTPVLDGLYVNTLQLALYIQSCLMLYYYMKHKNKKAIFLSLFSITLIPLIQLYTIHQINSSREMIIYSEKNLIHTDIRIFNTLYTSNYNSEYMKNFRTSRLISKVITMDSLSELTKQITIPDLYSIIKKDCSLQRINKFPIKNPVMISKIDHFKNPDIAITWIIAQHSKSLVGIFRCLDQAPPNTKIEVYNFKNNIPFQINL